MINRTLWVVRESPEEFPMTIFFDEVINLCEREKFEQGSASCRPATGEKLQNLVIYTPEISSSILSNCVSKICKLYRSELKQLSHHAIK